MKNNIFTLVGLIVAAMLWPLFIDLDFYQSFVLMSLARLILEIPNNKEEK